VARHRSHRAQRWDPNRSSAVSTWLIPGMPSCHVHLDALSHETSRNRSYCFLGVYALDGWSVTTPHMLTDTMVRMRTVRSSPSRLGSSISTLCHHRLFFPTVNWVITVSICTDRHATSSSHSSNPDSESLAETIKELDRYGSKPLWRK